jgi:hypothetical protein
MLGERKDGCGLNDAAKNCSMRMEGCTKREGGGKPRKGKQDQKAGKPKYRSMEVGDDSKRRQ